MRKRFFLNCLLLLVLIAVMSTSAFAISESDVESAVSASGKETVSGNVLVWFLCAIAFLKVSQKIDSFLSSLGLNVGHTGGSMLSEAMIAMRAINTATSAVGSALGSRSRHGSAPTSGKSAAGSAASAGFFSGGLVGMASRKIASDAVRTATAEKNIVQPQQAEATVSRTHANSDTHSGSQSASEQQRQNTSQLDQNQQTVSFRAVKSEQRENSQQALHESQHSVDASQIHQDSEDFQVLAITTMVSSFVAEWNDRSMKLYHEWKVMPSPPYRNSVVSFCNTAPLLISVFFSAPLANQKGARYNMTRRTKMVIFKEAWAWLLPITRLSSSARRC